jgi:hypothetical protein
MKVLKTLTRNFSDLKTDQKFKFVAKGKWYHCQRVYVIKSSDGMYGLISLNFFERLLKNICIIDLFKKKFEGKSITVIKPNEFNALEQRIDNSARPILTLPNRTSQVQPIVNTRDEKIQEFLKNLPKMDPLNPPPDPNFGQPELEPAYALDEKMKAKSPADQVESFLGYLDKDYHTSNEQFDATRERYENFIHSINTKQKITTKDLRNIDQFLGSTTISMLHAKTYSTIIRQIISKNPDLDKSKIIEARDKYERIAAIDWCYRIADVYGQEP